MGDFYLNQEVKITRFRESVRNLLSDWNGSTGSTSRTGPCNRGNPCGGRSNKKCEGLSPHSDSCQHHIFNISVCRGQDKKESDTDRLYDIWIKEKMLLKTKWSRHSLWLGEHCMRIDTVWNGENSCLKNSLPTSLPTYLNDDLWCQAPKRKTFGSA